ENILLQYISIFFVSMIPLVEVFVSVPTAIIVFNIPPLAALIVAILGNATSVLIFIYFGAEIKRLFQTVYHKFRNIDKEPIKVNPRIKQAFDRLGPTGVCFLSSVLFSSQIGAGTVSTIGAPRSQVFIWTNLGVST